MSIKDLIALCGRNLLRRRTRTALAIIGVVVGVCAIIVMLSIGFGLTKSYQDMIESYGNLHLIELSSNGSGQSSQDQGVLSRKNLDEIAKINGVGAVTPVLNTYGMVIDMNTEKQCSVSIRGVDASVLEKFNYSVQEGTLLKKSEPYGMLFGNMIPGWFYNPEDYSGDELIDVMKADLYFTMDEMYGYDYSYDYGETSKRPDYPMYEIVATGVLANPNDDSSYCVFMDLDTVELMQAEAKEAEDLVDYNSWRGEGVSGEGSSKVYNSAWVYVDDIKNTDAISETLRDQGYQTYSASDWLNSAKQTLAMIELVLGGIGGISLFVAAIGIANTMVMSVYERTREIGVMKVLGANLTDIRNMFLVEAGMIGMSGGAIGVIISFGISFIMNHFLAGLMGDFLGTGGSSATVSVIPLWLVFAALGFSFLVGVIAGFSPANKAMKASALNSLRAE